MVFDPTEFTRLVSTTDPYSFADQLKARGYQMTDEQATEINVLYERHMEAQRVAGSTLLWDDYNETLAAIRRILTA